MGSAGGSAANTRLVEYRQATQKRRRTCPLLFCLRNRTRRLIIDAPAKVAWIALAQRHVGGRVPLQGAIWIVSATRVPHSSRSYSITRGVQRSRCLRQWWLERPNVSFSSGGSWPSRPLRLTRPNCQRIRGCRKRPLAIASPILGPDPLESLTTGPLADTSS